MQRTLSIIKPDAVAKNLIGAILAQCEAAHLKIVAAKMMHLTPEQSQTFYAIHRERPFFHDLVKFMCSGPVMVQVLEGENAVLKYRDLMGATNPADAAPDTIRGRYASSIDENAVHGSDSVENAWNEIAFFFQPDEIYVRTR